VVATEKILFPVPLGLLWLINKPVPEPKEICQNVIGNKIWQSVIGN